MNALLEAAAEIQHFLRNEFAPLAELREGSQATTRLNALRDKYQN